MEYFDVKGPVPNPYAVSVISCLREWFINTAVCDVLWSDGGPPFGSTEVNNFLAQWVVEWRQSSPHNPQGNCVAESAVKWAKGLLRKWWRGRGQPLRTNEEWVKAILQWKNTPHKSTGLSLAILLYGHPVQDDIPCHKSSLFLNWHDDKLRIDRKAARRREKLEKHYNRGAKPLTQLKVGVTNKEICLVRIVSYLCKVLCHLFARLLIEKKRPFFLAIGFCCKYAFITSQSSLRHSKIPDCSSDSSFFEEFR